MENTGLPQDAIQKHNYELLATSKFSLNEKPSKVNINLSSLIATKSAIALNTEIGGDISNDSKIAQTMTRMCLEIGDRFNLIMARPNIDKDDVDYQKLVKETTNIAITYVPEVLKLLKLNVDLDSLVAKASFGDLLKIEARERNVELDADLTKETVSNSIIQSLDDKDSFKEYVDKIDMTNHNLSVDEEKALTVAIAFAQASYLHSQIFRARLEGTKRITRDQFNLNPVMKDIFYKKGGTNRQTFEVYKDVLELKQAVSAKITS